MKKGASPLRTIYLVRHGEPDLGPGKKHVCLGRTDAALSHEGEKQVQRLAQFFKGISVSQIWTSPLKRCVRTVGILAEKSGHKSCPVISVEDFSEVNTGIWDGLSFDEIREKWPEEYQERGTQIGQYVIPGGEAFEQAGERFAGKLQELLGKLDDQKVRKSAQEKSAEEDPENIVIVAHAGVIRALLCRITGKDINNLRDFNIPYASVTILRDNGQAFNSQPASASSEYARLLTPVCWADPADPEQRYPVIGLRPVSSLALSEVDRMWAECQVSMQQRAHMEMVADTAMNLIEYDLSLAAADWFDQSYEFRGTLLNTRLLYYAALLHDLKRADGGRAHAENGAAYLETQGYLELAGPVRRHHDPSVCRENMPLTEAEILYYADKLVQEDRLVSLEERFAKSLEKCITPQAQENHRKQLEAARNIEKKLG